MSIPNELVKAPKSARGRRIQRERDPKLVEDTKKAILLKAQSTSAVVNSVLKDLLMLKKPNAKSLVKKNEIRPMEDASSIEFLSKNNDCSLFAFASHTKKRPHNIIMGRLFDYQMLDMIELGVDARTYKSMKDLSANRKSVVQVDSKPCFIFMGNEFETNENFALFKNLILDFFRGDEVQMINLASLNTVITCAVHEDKIYFRHYGVLLKKSGTKVPRVELEEVGPTIDFTLRRVKGASAEMKKESLKRPRGTHLHIEKTKNVEIGPMGEKMGRVHMQKQNLDSLQLRKMKGLKKRKASDTDDEKTQETQADSSPIKKSKSKHSS